MKPTNRSEKKKKKGCVLQLLIRPVFVLSQQTRRGRRMVKKSAKAKPSTIVVVVHVLLLYAKKTNTALASRPRNVVKLRPRSNNSLEATRPRRRYARPFIFSQGVKRLVLDLHLFKRILESRLLYTFGWSGGESQTAWVYQCVRHRAQAKKAPALDTTNRKLD